MSHAYRAVGWNRQKKRYNTALWIGIVLYLVVFMAVGFALQPNVTAEILLMRAFGTAAFVLLHVVLSIGPLCRIDTRWLPWLYNRRHMGVSLFLVAFLHGVLALMIYHAAGDTNPFVSLFTANMDYDSLAHFPFQVLGFFALVILFLMAATSHDFWLANLTPPVWKALHMGVYVAYGLLVAHVALGFLQTERHPVLAALVGGGFGWIAALHIVAARKEAKTDTQDGFPTDDEGYCNVLAVDEIAEKRGRIVVLGGDRVAVFKYDGKVSAISNTCQHQNGPLGEGRVIDGLVTCPWHGFQYEPDTGASPPPFTEKVPTFNLKVVGGRVWVHPKPNPPGTRVEPATVEDPS